MSRLTPTEAANYLRRFYEAVAKRSGLQLPNSDYRIAADGTVIAITNDKNVVFVNPLFSPLLSFIYSGHLSKQLHWFAASGQATLSVSVDRYPNQVSIPAGFTFSFDMKRDVKHFIERLSDIQSVSLSHNVAPKPTLKVMVSDVKHEEEWDCGNDCACNSPA